MHALEQPVIRIATRDVVLLDMADAPDVAEPRPLAVLTIGDIERLRRAGHEPAAMQVWQACTYRPVVLPPDTPVREVARTLCDRQLHHVVVADDQGSVGVGDSLDLV